MYIYTHLKIGGDTYVEQGTQHHFSMVRSSHWRVFGGSSKDGGIGNSKGKCLWNAFTAFAVPSSSSISLPNSIVRILTWKYDNNENTRNF